MHCSYTGAGKLDRTGPAVCLTASFFLIPSRLPSLFLEYSWLLTQRLFQWDNPEQSQLILAFLSRRESVSLATGLSKLLSYFPLATHWLCNPFSFSLTHSVFCSFYLSIAIGKSLENQPPGCLEQGFLKWFSKMSEKINEDHSSFSTILLQETETLAES